MLGYVFALSQGFHFSFPGFILFVRPVAEYVKVLAAYGGREVSFCYWLFGIKVFFTL